jgi:hypothetical protein
MSWQTPNPAPLQETNRRIAGRRRVIWSARLRFDRGESDCIVMDVSPDGVRLRFPEGVPVDYDLCALEVPRMGRFTCEMSWRRGNHMGLRILGPAKRPERAHPTLAAVS